MSRFDKLDMSVFGCRGGVAWAHWMVECDKQLRRSGGREEYSLLSQTSDNPDILRANPPKGVEGDPHVRDLFLDAMSRAPLSTMKRYEELRGFARRFGKGWGDWVERTTPSEKELERWKDPIMMPLSSIDDGYARIAEMAAVNSAIELLTMDETLPEQLHGLKPKGVSACRAESLCLCADLDNGYLLKASTPSSLTWPTIDPEVLDLKAVFGEHVPSMRDVILDKAVSNDEIVTCIRHDLVGYSIFELLEPNAFRVWIEHSGEARVWFRREARSLEYPLIYQHKAGRDGIGADSEAVWRIEVDLSGANDIAPSAVFAAIDESTSRFTGARIFVQGDGPIIEVDHEDPAPETFAIGADGQVDIMGVGFHSMVAIQNAYITVMNLAVSA